MELDCRQLSSKEKVEEYLKITKRSDHSERTDNIAEAHESQSSESDVAGAGSELDNNSQSSCQPEENLASIKQSTQEGEFVRKSLQATPTLQKLDHLLISSTHKTAKHHIAEATGTK